MTADEADSVCVAALVGVTCGFEVCSSTITVTGSGFGAMAPVQPDPTITNPATAIKEPEATLNSQLLGSQLVIFKSLLVVASSALDQPASISRYCYGYLIDPHGLPVSGYKPAVGVKVCMPVRSTGVTLSVSLT